MKGVLLAIFSCMFGLGLIAAPPYAHAKILEGTSCDSEFMDVLNDRAWLNSKRSLEMAQTIMAKQASVLEYSCFENLRADYASNAGDFSDAVGGPDLDDSTDDLVSGPLATYLDKNFKNGPGADNCAIMNQIWNSARCSDFANDPFVSFDDLRKNDPRACSNDNDPDRDNNWRDAIKNSTLEPGQTPGVQSLDRFADLSDPNECSKIEPIPTGVQITRDGQTYDDKICPAPGCFYDPTKGVGGRCDDKP